MEWDASRLSWADFRVRVLGATDPKTAYEVSPGSLRGTLFAQWKDFGLKVQPDTFDNGFHGSASAFEGLVERMNWLGVVAEEDEFGGLLLQQGITGQTINDWARDPHITMQTSPPQSGSLFKMLEETDANETIDKCLLVNGPTDVMLCPPLNQEIEGATSADEALRPVVTRESKPKVTLASAMANVTMLPLSSFVDLSRYDGPLQGVYMAVLTMLRIVRRETPASTTWEEARDALCGNVLGTLTAMASLTPAELDLDMRHMLIEYVMLNDPKDVAKKSHVAELLCLWLHALEAELELNVGVSDDCVSP